MTGFVAAAGIGSTTQRPYPRRAEAGGGSQVREDPVGALALLEDARRRAHDVRVGTADQVDVLVLVVEPAQHVAHRLDPAALLVVALDDRPRRVGPVGVVEHRLLRLRVLAPEAE